MESELVSLHFITINKGHLQEPPRSQTGNCWNSMEFTESSRCRAMAQLSELSSSWRQNSDMAFGCLWYGGARKRCCFFLQSRKFVGSMFKHGLKAVVPRTQRGHSANIISIDTTYSSEYTAATPLQKKEDRTAQRKHKKNARVRSAKKRYRSIRPGHKTVHKISQSQITKDH